MPNILVLFAWGKSQCRLWMEKRMTNAHLLSYKTKELRIRINFVCLVINTLSLSVLTEALVFLNLLIQCKGRFHVFSRNLILQPIYKDIPFGRIERKWTRLNAYLKVTCSIRKHPVWKLGVFCRLKHRSRRRRLARNGKLPNETISKNVTNSQQQLRLIAATTEADYYNNSWDWLLRHEDNMQPTLR